MKILIAISFSAKNREILSESEDFPARHDEYLRQKMKRQRQAMTISIPAEEMPAQLKKAAKSVRLLRNCVLILKFF